MTLETSFLFDHIREIPDFPAPGILFKDITPLLADVDAFRFAIDAVADHWSGDGIDAVVGVEARGFILAAPIAYRLGVGLVPVRKAGKLPHDVNSTDYECEYGPDRLEIHVDGLAAGHRVLLVDDVLATGGTAAAATELVKGSGADLAGYSFLAELASLEGRSALAADVAVHSLMVFD